MSRYANVTDSPSEVSLSDHIAFKVGGAMTKTGEGIQRKQIIQPTEEGHFPSPQVCTSPAGTRLLWTGRQQSVNQREDSARSPKEKPFRC